MHWNTAVWGETIPLTITGGMLLVSADTDTLYGGGENPQGSSTLDITGKLSVSVHVVGEAEPLDCTALEKANVTNAAMDGCDLSAHVGKNATLQITIDGSALLYMVGFRNSSGSGGGASTVPVRAV